MIVSNNTTFPPNVQGDKTTKFACSDGCAMIHLQTLLFCLAGEDKRERQNTKLTRSGFVFYIHFILAFI